jgi:hypothetical protein
MEDKELNRSRFAPALEQSAIFLPLISVASFMEVTIM